MKYVALLRGIGPLNPNMKNDKLRSVFESLGFRNVSTVLSSGNVLFETPLTDAAKLEAMAEKVWPKQLGFTSTTIIRSHDELSELAAKQPFRGLVHNADTYLTVTFLQQASSSPPPDGHGYRIVGVHPRAICVATDRHATKTPDMMARFEKTYGKAITTRTWQTIERILKGFEK